MNASPWGVPDAPTLPTLCPTCRDSGEVWDGRTYEHDTGQPVTATCPDCCNYLMRKTA